MITKTHVPGPAAAMAAGALAMLFLASCASSPASRASSPPSSSSPARSSPSSGSSSPAGTAAGASGAPGSCPASGLHAVVNAVPGGGAAGTVYVAIDFTNVSGHTCTMYGYPGVSFVTDHPGTQIGAAASRQTAFAAQTVTLPAGGSAHAWLGVANAGNYPASVCHPVTAHTLRIYPPNQFAALYASYTTTVCSGTVTTGTPLLVLPVRPGQATAQHVP